MTQRERQILRWIEENPMISQQELAEKAGITRSSVAVHISNLMKKGFIAGKGYVLRSGTYVVVVGGVNMDIGGTSFASMIARGFQSRHRDHECRRRWPEYRPQHQPFGHGRPDAQCRG